MKKNTHKERMLNVLKRQPNDFVPAQFDFSPAALDKLAAHMNIRDKGETALLTKFDNHIVYAYVNDVFGQIRRRVNFSEKVVYDNFGVGWDTSQEGTSFCFHPLYDKDKIVKYEMPSPKEEKLMDFAKEVIPLYKDEYLVASYQTMAVFERAYALRGFENFMMDMIDDEDYACCLLDEITNYQVEIAKRYVAEGVNCCRTGDDYGAQNKMIMSPDLWRKMIKPRLNRIWDVYKNEGIPIIHHSCGDVRPIVDDMIEMGLDMLNNIQAEAMPREEIIERFGTRLSFYGGISAQDILPHGTTDDVKKEVFESIRVLNKHNGYLASTGISITSDVPIENVVAMYEAIMEYQRK